MQSEPYVALSAQLALNRRLTSLAINVANINTIGYRATGITFHTYLANTGGADNINESIAYATPGTTFISRAHGPLIETGNPLDVAVRGNGWFAIQTPLGTAYTRDGRMRMEPDGELKTIDGHPILDAGGAPIVLNPNGGPPTITRDGMITQNGRQLGAIGLFEIPANAKVTRYENSALFSKKPATPVLDFNANGIIQRHLEGSNVNPVLEMAKLMQINRAFDNITNAAQLSSNTLTEAVKTLGNVA